MCCVAGLLASSTARDVALEFFETNRDSCEKWTEAQWKEQMLALFETMHTKIRDMFLVDKGSEAGPSKAAGPSKRYVDDKGIVRNPNGDPIHGGTTGNPFIFM